MTATFRSIDHTESAGETLQVNLSPAPIVKALYDLTAAVKAIKPDVRIELPAMNPKIEVHPAPLPPAPPPFPPAPISVTVPDFPAPVAPVVNITVPDFPPFPAIPAPIMAQPEPMRFSWRAGAALLAAFVAAETAAHILSALGSKVLGL